MANGRPVPAGSHVASTPHGDQVRMRSNGRPADVHVAGRNMDIHNGLNGGRRVEVVRADHSRIVAERGGRGFVEHPYRYGGREYAHRSYYYHGRPYDRYYGHYYYGGAYVDYYTPAFYYRPAFYGWAYNPWAVPFAYSWGWAATPWYGFYGAAYFTPYPVYASASLWLTDYLISQSLQAAYEANVAAAAQQQALAAGAAGLTPDVKDLISAEVQRQIALENAEAQTAQASAPDPASSSIQRMLTDNVQHIFVVGQNLDIINTATNGECAVSQGDALQLAGPPAADATAASLIVLSSKGGVECPKSATVQVQISDLQEMQNHMRETIDAGMGDLKSKQGTGGIPALPVSASGEPVKATFVSAAPPPDPNASAEINQQLQAADQAQNQVVAEASNGSAPAPAGTDPAPAPAVAAAPASISLGQSIDDVTAAMGQPTKIVDLGPKKIYVYKDMKVTFKAGKVSDVQ
jgi:hypothetical protein